MYDYENANKSNKLQKVTDSSLTLGFNDGNKTGNDYTYDVNGNLTKDLNKGIAGITYNFLNLPTEVLWNTSKKINYTYNGAGVKLNKVVTDGTTVSTTEYLDGFQYKDGVLQFFPTAEGYVNAITAGAVGYNYVYNMTDHLGNVRVSYAWDNVNSKLKTVNEDHYYPFGLQHQGYNKPPKDITGGIGSVEIGIGLGTSSGSANYKYKYNGKELQDELNLNLYDYGARNYDPAIGRYFSIDRMSEAYFHLNPYQYTTNNPVKFIDINGDYIYIYDNGTKYKYDNGQLYSKNEETGKFDVEYTASEGSYASQILGMLNQIGCENCKGGKAFLNLFNNDDFNVGIRNNTYNGRYKGKNVTRQNGKSMEVMTFFKQKENIATTSGFESLTKNMFATIGHELGHALSDFIFDNKVTDATWYSMTNDRGTTSNIKNDEVYAMFIENMIRRENNIPQRTHYSLTGEGSVMEESRMMKKVNKTWMIDDKAYSILQKIQQTQKK